MVNPTWTAKEERVFWGRMIPKSPKAIGLDRMRDSSKSWKELADEMIVVMGTDAKRCYGPLGLFEHFFQNAVNQRFSPYAARHVRTYIDQHAAHYGDTPNRLRKAGKYKIDRPAPAPHEVEHRDGKLGAAGKRSKASTGRKAKVMTTTRPASASEAQSSGSTATAEDTSSNRQHGDDASHAMAPANPGSVTLFRVAAEAFPVAAEAVMDPVATYSCGHMEAPPTSSHPANYSHHHYYSTVPHHSSHQHAELSEYSQPYSMSRDDAVAAQAMQQIALGSGYDMSRSPGYGYHYQGDYGHAAAPYAGVQSTASYYPPSYAAPQYSGY